MSARKKCIVWFRRDLRLDDHLALHAACKDYEQVIPLYIHSPNDEGDWPQGGASLWWLHHALDSLKTELESKGGYLVRRVGDTLKILTEMIESEKPDALYFNRRYEPQQIELEDQINRKLSNKIECRSFVGNLLFDPHEIKTQQGNCYQVYTPFWKACVSAGPPPKPVGTPQKISSPSQKPRSDRLSALQLLPDISWDDQFYEFWDPTIAGARSLYSSLMKKKVESYKTDRDIPSLDGTSRLSPYLHFGQLSPRRLWHGVGGGRVPQQAGKLQYVKEILWREFAQYLLIHFPHLPTEPLRPEFKKFPWRESKKDLKAWQRGQTGYPLVDAGMRQLYAVGWMHNRVRMVVASFLVKHLLLSWQDGASWFWDCLVDADLGSNTMGWQWAGGCGPDAAPYFRIFNPIIQSEKFDPNGDYIREWVPELGHLNKKQIHTPWELTPLDLKSAGVVLGKDYPFPMVDHKSARQRALDAYEKVKKS